MSVDTFIQKYENALASQNWLHVEPLICTNATVTFSNGHSHIGKSQIKIAFEKNFKSIKNEAYAIQNINWLLKNNSVGVYTFDFKWSGIIKGVHAEGAGKGTSVIMNEDEAWRLLTEHLGPKPK